MDVIFHNSLSLEYEENCKPTNLIKKILKFGSWLSNIYHNFTTFFINWTALVAFGKRSFKVLKEINYQTSEI